MKKNLLKISLFLLMISLTIQNTYAATFKMDVNTAFLMYLLFGSFIVIGLIILVIGKKGDKNIRSYENEDKKDNNEIIGLIDHNKIDRSFNPDSIFKDIPTFSNKKFFEATIEELKNNINEKEKNIEEITIIDKGITDFKTENKKFIITSEYLVSYKQKDQPIEIETKYIIISEKDKENNTPIKPITRCPNCGGKIKNNTKNRCLYCGNPLEKDFSKSTTTWIITEIKNGSI